MRDFNTKVSTNLTYISSELRCTAMYTSISIEHLIKEINWYTNLYKTKYKEELIIICGENVREILQKHVSCHLLSYID